MKLFDRYLIRQFMGTFILLVLSLPVLFLITDLTENLESYIGRGLKFRPLAVSYLFYMPQLMFYGFPIAALIATVFTIGNMTRHQEITAAKAGGVSFYRLVMPIVFLGVLLSAAAVGIAEAVPVANQRRAELLGTRERFTIPIRMNLVYRTETGRTLTANQVNGLTDSMDNVVIESGDPDTGLWVQHTAAAAAWNELDGWTLREGYLRWRDNNGVEATARFAVMKTPDLKETPTELVAQAKEPEEMRYSELQRFIDMVQRSGGDPRAAQVNLEQRLSLSVAVLVIVLFGLPLTTSTRRGGGTAFGIGMSLAITMCYLMLFKVGEAMGESGAISPIMAAWIPNILFFVAALGFLWRVRT